MKMYRCLKCNDDSFVKPTKELNGRAVCDSCFIVGNIVILHKEFVKSNAIRVAKKHNVPSKLLEQLCITYGLHEKHPFLGERLNELFGAESPYE